jgi:hypothetical protein
MLMLHAAGGFFGRFGGRCGTFGQGVILEIPAGRSVLWSIGFAEFGRSVGFWTSGFQVVSLGSPVPKLVNTVGRKKSNKHT